MVLDVAVLGSLEPLLQCLLELSTGDGRGRGPWELGRQPEASISLGLRDTGRSWSPGRGWDPVDPSGRTRPLLESYANAGWRMGRMPCFSLLTPSTLPPCLPHTEGMKLATQAREGKGNRSEGQEPRTSTGGPGIHWNKEMEDGELGRTEESRV